MIDLTDRLQRASEEIAGQVVDGEAIVMHLGTGNYYSLNPVASRVWELSEQGYAVSQVVCAIAHDYGASEDVVSSGVLRIANELAEEGLMAPGEATAGDWSADGAGESREYVEPAIEKYSDMAELLALDPPMPGVAESPWLGAETAK